jgi:hypothetical protein
MPYTTKTVIREQIRSTKDETTYTSTTADARLGSNVVIKFDVGENVRATRKLIRLDMVFNLALQGLVETNSECNFSNIWCLMDNYELLINNVVVARTISTDTRHGRTGYYQHIMENEEDSLAFLSRIQEDMDNLGTSSTEGNWDPLTVGSACTSRRLRVSDLTAIGSGYEQCFDMSAFFSGIFERLTFHRIKSIEFRFKLTRDELLQKISYQFLGADNAKTPADALVFRDFRFNLRYDDYASPLPDPSGVGQLIMSHPRRETKRYPKAFDNATRSIRVNLKQDFSRIDRLSRIYFFTENPDITINDETCGQLSPLGVRDYESVEVFVNSKSSQKFSQSQLLAFQNKQLVNEHGHHYIHHNQFAKDNAYITLLLSNAFIPSISFAGVEDSNLTTGQHRRLLILSGQNNQENTIEIVFTVSVAASPVDLFVECVSIPVAEIHPNYSVKVTGLD